jgi:hypothetical protein
MIDRQGGYEQSARECANGSRILSRRHGCPNITDCIRRSCGKDNPPAGRAGGRDQSGTPVRSPGRVLTAPASGRSPSRPPTMQGLVCPPGFPGLVRPDRSATGPDPRVVLHLRLEDPAGYPRAGPGTSRRRGETTRRYHLGGGRTSEASSHHGNRARHCGPNEPFLRRGLLRHLGAALRSFSMDR